jgi:hypothetical protein
MAHPDHDPDVGDVLLVEWTEGLALRVAGVSPDRTRDDGDAIDGLRDAIDADRLPGEAVEVLIAAGWPLDD